MPFTVLGKFIASVAMIIGYTIIAVPTGIVTSEMVQANVVRVGCGSCGADIQLSAKSCSNCGAANEHREGQRRTSDVEKERVLMSCRPAISGSSTIISSTYDKDHLLIPGSF